MPDMRAPSPVTVCRVIARLNIGGPAIHTILLTSRLPSDRYRSFLIKGSESHSEGNMEDLAAREGISLIRLPQMGREIHPLKDFIALVKLVQLFWRQRPAIVHTHTAKAGALGRLAAQAINWARHGSRFLKRSAPPRIRIIHTYHGHIFEGYFSSAKTRLFLLIEKLLARVTDVVIVISPLQRKEIVDRYRIARSSQVRIIPLGLDLSPFLSSSPSQGKLRAELGVGNGTKLIGIVGRLVPIKRHDVLFRAIDRLEDLLGREADYLCLVVGDGELLSQLKRLAEGMGITRRVRFLGWRENLEAIYSDLDCLVVSSDNEGTPVSAIEAMASGVPVVASAVGGVPDLFPPLDEGEAPRDVALRSGEVLSLWEGPLKGESLDGPRLASSGILVPPGDDRALALALELLWSKPDLMASCGRWARAWVGEAFSIERLVADIDALYRELLGEGDALGEVKT
jgi:glycosyltransferase involved in cell wall biosynthesis